MVSNENTKSQRFKIKGSLSGLVNLNSEVNDMHEEYYKELCILCSKKTKLDFNDGFAINPIEITSTEIVRLEQFIHKNNLFDTNEIWRIFADER